jgi:hypothetical protein
LALIVLAVAACSDAGNNSGGDRGSQASTPAPPTSIAAAKASLSTAGARHFTAGDPPATPEPFEGSGGALGSGCAPGAGALPDGAWFGHAVHWDLSGIDFDLACFYVGDAAAAQAAARHEEEPPPNDFFIVNDSKAVRRVAVAPNAIGYRLVDRGGIVLERTTYASLLEDSGRYEPCPAAWCPVWVFINAGEASEVMQQYLP